MLVYTVVVFPWLKIAALTAPIAIAILAGAWMVRRR